MHISQSKSLFFSVIEYLMFSNSKFWVRLRLMVSKLLKQIINYKNYKPNYLKKIEV